MNLMSSYALPRDLRKGLLKMGSEQQDNKSREAFVEVQFAGIFNKEDRLCWNLGRVILK